MAGDYHQWGKRTARSKLGNPRAKGFAAAIQKCPYATLRRTSVCGDSEGVEFDIQPTLPQRPVADIRRIERICVVLGSDDLERPNVLALRRDFPILSHTYLTPVGDPVQLCLFEDDYSEVRTSLTPELLLAGIQDWLERAALGQLHLPEQGLEPFLLANHTLIVDPRILYNDHLQQLLTVVGLSEEPGEVAVIVPIAMDQELPGGYLPFLGLPLKAEAWRSDVINRSPRNLEQLADLLRAVNIDLIEELRAASKELMDHQEHTKLVRCRWIVLLVVPKARTGVSAAESSELWAFLTDAEVGDLGCRLGIWQKQDGCYGLILGKIDVGELTEVGVCVARTTSVFTRHQAHAMAGVSVPGDLHVTAIGAGALGSQVILNLVRQGLGKWTILDHDRLLPHNLARHALFPESLGLSKAKEVGRSVCCLLDDASAAQGHNVNILRIGPTDEMAETIMASDHIYDFSVSQAVSRHLALMAGNVPRTSVFLTGRGQFLVILAEGRARAVRLDDLELQLALACLERDELSDLFLAQNGTTIRYAGSCRDVTTVLGQDIVATHAGIASQFLRQNLEAVDPSAIVWKLSGHDLTVARYQLNIAAVRVHEVDCWEIRLSEHAARQMQSYRRGRLPNETGGVLLGAFDVSRNIVYVSGVLPSPPDSDEWLTGYIRGIEGLPKTTERINDRTAGALSYVGEWHSHPDGCSSKPSADDRKAHRWIVKRMAETGHPGLIVIQGESPEPHLLMGEA